MNGFQLIPQAALGGYDQGHDGIHIYELTGYGLVSLSIPHNGKDTLDAQVQSAYHIDLPKVGQSTQASQDNVRFLGLQQDQQFILFDYQGDQAVQIVKDKLAESAYLTDQSDSWVMLRLTGENTRLALERICMLDLHPDVFVVNSVARTVMEYLSVIILCEAKDQYLLLSPRSSAQSFLHAITTSIDNIS